MAIFREEITVRDSAVNNDSENVRVACER